MARENLKKFIALASAALVWNDAAAFTAIRSMTSTIGKAGINPGVLVMALSPLEEQQAAAMSEYLVKAHEEKLKAVQKVEQQKQTEIDLLKKQLDELRQKPAPQASAMVATASRGRDLLDLTHEQMVNKLQSYQKFMSKYIVDAQEQKIRAVKAAEEATAKKYQEQTPLLTGNAPKAVPETVAKAQVSKETQLFLERSAKVSAAGEKGKSRWGDKEVERAKNSVASIAVRVNGDTQPATIPTPPQATDATPIKNAAATPRKTTAATSSKETAATPPKAAAEVPVPPEVAAADHGLRSDGGVGGLTLAERVALGAKAAAPSEEVSPATIQEATLSHNEVLFQKRNALVVAAGRAGKSRWGTMEVERAQKQAVNGFSGAPEPSPVKGAEVPAEVTAADHGLRSDGGVGGPSLAERVNLGAALLQQDRN